MIKGMPNTDYKELSFNQLIELVGSLYEEITRLTAERKASDEALTKLSHDVRISEYSLTRIETVVKRATLAAIEESRAKRPGIVRKAKRKK